MYPRQKKVLSLLLSFVACFYLLTLSSSTPAYPYTEEAEPIAEKKDTDTPLLEEAMAAANNLVRLDSTEINNSSITDTVFFTTASTNTEYVSRLYRVSDEILAASTPELLDYFLQSQFMRDMLAKEIAASSVSLLQQKNHEDYFFYHDAFNELIRRDDLTAALDMCARQITTSSIRNNDTYCFKAEFKALSEFLNHSTISSIVSKTVTTDEYSYLAHVYTCIQ